MENAPKVTTISIVPNQRNEEQNNSLQVSYVNSSYNCDDHREQTNNEDEVGFKIKTENKDPKDDTDVNTPNAGKNSKKMRKSSDKHLKEVKAVKTTQHGKLKLSQRRRIKDAIIKFNHDMAERTVDEIEGLEKCVVDRIRASGPEMHDDLDISDYKQYYDCMRSSTTIRVILENSAGETWIGFSPQELRLPLLRNWSKFLLPFYGPGTDFLCTTLKK